MKNLSGISACLLLCISLLFGACKKDDNSSSSSNLNTISTLNSTVVQGTWKITSFIDSGNDETNHYFGYQFQFNTSGSLIAQKSGVSTNGTWSSGTDDSTLKLILNFGANIPFEELNDDWHVVQQSTVLIKLEDVSGGGGGTDYLTFEKN